MIDSPRFTLLIQDEEKWRAVAWFNRAVFAADFAQMEAFDDWQIWENTKTLSKRIWNKASREKALA